jgi:hypothetical protein
VLDPVEVSMPILPIVDLLILMAWTSLFGACALKAIRVTTSYHPSLLGMGSMDLVIVSAVLLLFALTLTARSWLKKQEFGGASARERASETLEAYSALQVEMRRSEASHEIIAEEEPALPGPASIHRPPSLSVSKSDRGRSHTV